MTTKRPARTAALVLAAACLSACTTTHSGSATDSLSLPWSKPSTPAVAAPAAAAATPAQVATAKAALATLPTVKTIGTVGACMTTTKTGKAVFNREGMFGPAWNSTPDAKAERAPLAHGDTKGMDTRNYLLASSLTSVAFKTGSTRVVASGVLPYDPYTGKRNVAWSKTTASTLQVDHVYPLARACAAGAWSWTPAERQRFANDTRLNLVLADGPQNGSKSAQGPATWLVPANPAYAKTYATKYVTVTAAYNKRNPGKPLVITVADKAALTKALS